MTVVTISRLADPRASDCIPAYLFDRTGLFVRVIPQLLKCVVFLGIETERGGFMPIGTGSFVAYQMGDHMFLFVMTAAHLVDNLAEEARPRLVLRINRRESGASIVKPDLNFSFRHTHAATDVILISAPIDPTIFDVVTIPGNRDVVEQLRAHGEGTYPGDTVCAVGVYTSHFGLTKNAPVLRSGHIAAIPGDPVWTRRGYAEAYLIELRTFAGLSGSPVFQTAPAIRVKDGAIQFRNEPESYGTILGMLIGYHGIEDRDDLIAVPRIGPQEAHAAEDRYSFDERNTGFGIVIPIERVFEIFERDDVQQGFKNAIELVRSLDIKDTGG